MGWESTYETLRVDVDFFVDSFVGHLPSYELQWWTAYHAHLPITFQRQVGHPTHVISICRGGSALSNDILFVGIGLYFVH